MTKNFTRCIWKILRFINSMLINVSFIVPVSSYQIKNKRKLRFQFSGIWLSHGCFCLQKRTDK